MRWEDERYVRVYTRDTPNWARLSWEARALLLELFRKVDRAGILELGEDGYEGLTALLRMPSDVVSRGAADLIAKKTITIKNGNLLVTNFIDAQETRQNDKRRKTDERERAAARVKYEALTGQDVSDTGVTSGHQQSPEFTDGHSDPIRSEPTLSEPLRTIPDSATPPRGELDGDQGSKFDFEAVYALYPRKEGRKKGLQRCRSQITSRKKYDALVMAVKNYAARTPDLAFAKHFDTFMNCWQDYVEQLPLPVTAPRGGTLGASTSVNPEDRAKRGGGW